MRLHLRVLNLRLSLILALAVVVFWLISRSTYFQPEKARNNFHSVDLLKRSDRADSSKAGSTENRPVTTDQEGFNVDTWQKLVDNGEKLIYNMRTAADGLTKKPGMNSNSESVFQVSVYPFYLRTFWLIQRRTTTT